MSRYRTLSAAIAVLVVALAVVLPAAPASAHTVLKSTAPVDKSTTTKPVTEVTLTFSGLIRKPETAVSVTGPDKISHSAGEAQVVDRTITQKVTGLPVGMITVRWQTAASDGHPMGGTFMFNNKAEPITPPTPTAEPSPTSTAQPSIEPVTSGAAPPQSPVAQASDDGSSSSPVVWVVAVAVALALVALVGLLWRRRRSGM
ncbi:hypothetical protein GCM10022251_13900 [Phytohabitans flavus]